MVTGVQVDAWGAFVPGRGNLIDQLRTGVTEAMRERQLPNLEINTGEMAMSTNTIGSFLGEKREYIFFNQKFGISANATLALRIARRGAEDLELSWRLLESDPAKSLFLGLSQGTLVFLGIVVAGAGLILSIVGIGLFMLPLGIFMIGSGLGWWGAAKNKSRLTADQMLDARVLTQTVDYCLMKELEKLGVSASELRVLQAARLEGIGNLGPKT